jgi:hypoxanthine phosphoribosyltransferase
LTEPDAPERVIAATPSFAHQSEAELARILDFYEVRWAYEPDTFPIGWNLEGEVIESFSPDFYLPELDLYVELTTLKQKLVRKKNRKLRRLRELYPDVRIKLFYARDFRMLLLKFGRLALVDELTGTTGQATPPRATADAADEPAADPAIAAMLAVREADAELPVPSTPAPAAAGAPVAAAGRTTEPGAPATRGRRRGRRRRRPAG